MLSGGGGKSCTGVGYDYKTLGTGSNDGVTNYDRCRVRPSSDKRESQDATRWLLSALNEHRS